MKPREREKRRGVERPGSSKHQQEGSSRGRSSLKRERNRDGQRDSLRRNGEAWDKSKMYSVSEKEQK